MAASIVFFDIAGPDGESLRSFYSEVFGWDTSAAQFSVTVSTPLMAAIRQDPHEKRLYLGVADIDKKMAAIEKYGGTVDAPRFEVPGVVVLGLFKDPAGNPMGLVEIKDGIPVVPTDALQS